MTRSTDFDATVKHGTRAVQPDLVIYARPGSRIAEAPKVGLIVARSVGSAVQRHRLARRLRHVARTVAEGLAVRARGHPGAAEQPRRHLGPVGTRIAGRLAAHRGDGV